jgi:nicotinate phosphoribosyltransferase
MAITKAKQIKKNDIKKQKQAKKVATTTTKKPTRLKVHDGADFYAHKHIINYLTETDLYKFTQQQFYVHRRPNDRAKWEFKCRTKGVNLAPLCKRINEELDWLCSLKFQSWELDWFKKQDYFSHDYVEFLEDFQLKRRHIKCFTDKKNTTLFVEAEGSQKNVSPFEIYVLHIVQALWMADEELDWEKAKTNLDNEIMKVNAATRAGIIFTISDFSVRRTISSDWEDYMVGRMLAMCPAFVGTSNVYLAIKHNCKAIGTFAHELDATYQGLDSVPIANAQKQKLTDWADEYDGKLGIALSDNYGFKSFLEDFGLKFAKLFDGCRHDSGDPIRWGEMLIAHYKKLGIDPRSKVACWSDSLDIDKALAIAKHFNGRIKIAFGIGTYLGATVCGTKKKPLSMVMKVVEVNGKPVVKLSDSIGKTMCHDEGYINYVKSVYNYKSIDDMTTEEIRAMLPAFVDVWLKDIYTPVGEAA